MSNRIEQLTTELIEEHFDFTEADEAAGGNKEQALINLQYQVMNDETMGIIAMFEEAAMKLGCSPDEVEAARQRGLANRSI